MVPGGGGLRPAGSRGGGGALTVAPLLRFHLAVGARLAMLALAPALVAAVAGGMLLGDDFLVSLARMLFGPGSSGGTWALLVAMTLGAASAAAPRICRGLSGWLRHLPVDGLSHRRAAALAVAVAQSPLLILLAVLSVAGAAGRQAFLVDVLALAVTALATAVAVVPARRRLASAPLALAAALVAGSGAWLALAAGAGLLAMADAVAGPLARVAPATLIHGRGGRLPGPWIEARIAWRALGWRLAGAYVAGLLPLLACFAFANNNEPLAPAHQRLATLLGGGWAVALLFAQLAETLAVRRPAWPWSRSLPGSARRRVGFDAVFLALHTLPLFALGIRMAPTPWALLAPAALVPFLSLRAAGAMRRAPERKTGAAGEILGEGLFLGALVSLLPWTALLALPAVPWALKAAAERDRAQKVSRWLELHHLAAGDPQSWSAS
ncbi:MAG TPA: hypothetical protein VLQ45_33370 [Thermoanaerobaculia bacterium]|nr:hypothetical protein [Thermoanaerobaculia bacterium]